MTLHQIAPTKAHLCDWKGRGGRGAIKSCCQGAWPGAGVSHMRKSNIICHLKLEKPSQPFFQQGRGLPHCGCAGSRVPGKAPRQPGHRAAAAPSILWPCHGAMHSLSSAERSTRSCRSHRPEAAFAHMGPATPLQNHGATVGRCQRERAARGLRSTWAGAQSSHPDARQTKR